MKRLVLALPLVAILVCWSGIAVGQGYDLLSTGGGTQDNLSSLGLGTVTFQGVPLPSSAGVGSADTIVWRENPIPSPGGYINIQVVALHLESTGTVTCGSSSLCGSYYGQPVNVHATINQVTSIIPLSQLPQPDPLSASTGQMQVFASTFNTTSLTIQADLIVLPAGGVLGTTKPVFTTPMPSDNMTSSGNQWMTTAPPGYPASPNFPAGGFYVDTVGAPHVFAALTSGVFRFSLYGLGLLLFGLSVMKVRSGVAGGRISLRPAYLLSLAAITWFLAWKTNSFAFPMIAHAKAICETQSSTHWVEEYGVVVEHVVQTAGCSPLSITATTSSSVAMH